jgi:hypothetical protein
MNRKLTKYFVLALVAVITLGACSNPAAPKIPGIADPLRVFLDSGDFSIFVNHTAASKSLDATTLPADGVTFAWTYSNTPSSVATVAPLDAPGTVVTDTGETLGITKVTVTATRGTETASTSVYGHILFDPKGVNGAGGTSWVNTANNAYVLNDDLTYTYHDVYLGGNNGSGTYSSTGTIVTLTATGATTTTSFEIAFNETDTKWQLDGIWTLQ